MFTATKERERRDERTDSPGHSSCEGFAVLDPLGQKFGEVEQLFSDVSGRPRHLRVRIGGFFVAKSVLIPIRDVDIDREDRTLALL